MSDLKQKIEAAQIDLIKELGIDQLDQVKKEELLQQIGEVLQQRIVLRIMEELPEEKIDEFNEILKKAQENPDALDQFLIANIPGVDDLVLEEIGDYKQGAKDFMNQTLNKAGVNSTKELETELEGEEKISEPTETEATAQSVAQEKPVVSEELEKEQVDQEAQILEENKVEETQPGKEELDLSSEIEKMNPENNQ